MSFASAVGGFTVLAALLTVVPGLDTALVLRAAVTHSRRHAFATALGINTGALVWGVGAAIGVSALLTASTVAYPAVRIAGAVYMIWLGFRLLRQAIRGERAGEPGTVSVGSASPAGAGRAWTRGLLTNLLNPKVGAFYVAVLPQFIPTGASPLLMGALLALIHDGLGLAWFTALIATATTMRKVLRYPTAARTIDGLTGSALIGFGTKLGLSAR
jgi:threonine/homoserine/homoserine lactone efflux protein